MEENIYKYVRKRHFLLNRIKESLKIHKKLFYLGIIALLAIALPLTIFLSSQKTLQEIRTIAGLEQDIEVLTQKLVLRKGSSTNLISVAIQRKSKMKTLAKQNPDKFLLNIVSSDIKNKLPKEARKSIEQKVEVEGSLIETVDDNETPTFKLGAPSLILQTVDNEGFVSKAYTLYFREGQSPKIGTKVKVKGYLLNKVIVPISLERVGGIVRTSAGLETSGNKKIAVLMVNFKDNTNTQNEFTVDDLEKIYFTEEKSTTKYLQKASFNKLTFQGDRNDIYGWLTLDNYSRGDACDIYETGRGEGFVKAAIDKAKIEAQVRGKNFSEYNFIGFIFPYASGLCDGRDDETQWGSAIARGVGNVDSNAKPYHFLNGNYCGHSSLCASKDLNYYAGLMAHEIGHNLGLSHANGLNCGNQIIGTYNNCKSFTYADRFDVIGGGWTYQPHPSASNQNLYLKYIPDSNKITVTRGNERADGQYSLYSLSRERANQTQFIRIPRPVEGGAYYLEYRSKENSDTRLPNNVFKGAILRLSEIPDWKLKDENGNYQNRGEQTYLVDLSNSNPKTSWRNFTNPAFKNGQIFDDKKNKITITQVSHSQSQGSVTLKIAFGETPCVLDNPALLLNEPRQSGLPGEKISYALTITNNNSPSCPDASFNLSAQAPIEWSASFPTSSVGIVSGQSTTVTAEITSPSSATVDGSPYVTQITVQNSANSAYKKTKPLKYDIEQSPSPTPTPSISPSPSPSPSPTPSPTPTPSPSPSPSPSPTPIACNYNPPTITVNPDIRIAKAGEFRRYDITLKSNDTAGCSARNFSFALTLPGSNWTYSPKLTSLSPKQTKTVTLNVTSALSATKGTKYLALTISGGNNNTVYLTKILTFVVK